MIICSAARFRPNVFGSNLLLGDLQAPKPLPRPAFFSMVMASPPVMLARRACTCLEMSSMTTAVPRFLATAVAMMIVPSSSTAQSRSSLDSALTVVMKVSSLKANSCQKSSPSFFGLNVAGLAVPFTSMRVLSRFCSAARVLRARVRAVNWPSKLAFWICMLLTCSSRSVWNALSEFRLISLISFWYLASLWSSVCAIMAWIACSSAAMFCSSSGTGSGAGA